MNEKSVTYNNYIAVPLSRYPTSKDLPRIYENNNVNVYNPNITNEESSDVSVNNEENKEDLIKKLFMAYPNREPCLHDYSLLEPQETLKYDKRGFWRYILDSLISEHPVVSLFKKSIFNPFFIRITFFIYSVVIGFGFNAMLYTDEYIDQKADTDKETRVKYNIKF